MEEFEITFLEVDVPELEKKLLSIGAKKVGEYDYKRLLMDYPDFRLNENHSWLKLRTDGEETTLSYKQRLGVKSDDGSIPDDGMKEIEIVVDDFQKTFELLKALGFIIKREAENRRIRYKKGNAVFDIDFWPQIPTYLEVEADSMKAAEDAAKELGLDPSKGLICSPQQVYKRYGIDLNDYYSMTFKEFIKK